MKENNFKQTEIGLIPEDWEVVRFEEAILRKRIKVGKIKQQEYQKFGKYPVIDQSQNYIAGFSDDDQKVYQGPLPVIIFGDHTRIFKFVDFPFIVGADGVKIIIPNRNIFDPKFLYFAFLMLKIPSRGYNRHYPLLREKKIPLPPLEEQQKIAKVLDKIQQAIEIQDRIIEQAKNLKKSLMQKLFTEGLYGEEQKETEIGLIPKSWEVVRLGEIAHNFLGGGTPSTKRSEYWNGSIPWITSAYMKEDKLFIDEGERYITEKGLKNSSTQIIPKYNLLIGTRVGVGKVAINLIDIAINQDLTGVIVKEDSIDLSYLAYVLLSEQSQSQFRDKTRGTTIKGIPREDLKSILIPLPPLEEQKQIAHILSTVDKKIEVEQKRKQILKELFKTMLHKLMSGEIRLKGVEI